jgi:hypothetical protein
MRVLDQEHYHVLPVKASYKNVFFSYNDILKLLEPVYIYTSIDVSILPNVIPD